MKIKLRNLMVTDYELTGHFSCLSYAARANVAIAFSTQEEEWFDCGRLFDYFVSLLFMIEDELTVKNDCSPRNLSFDMLLPDGFTEIRFLWDAKDRYTVIDSGGSVLGNVEIQEIVSAVLDFVSEGIIAFSCGSIDLQLAILNVICPGKIKGKLTRNLERVRIAYQPVQPKQMRKIDAEGSGWILFPKDE